MDKVGHIVIRNISVVDDHDAQARAALPADVEITDETSKEKVISTALAEHYGVWEAQTKRAPRVRK